MINTSLVTNSKRFIIIIIIIVKRATYSSKKRSLAIDDLQHQKKNCRAWEVKNYLMDQMHGEDINSQTKHIERLREQSMLSTLRQDQVIITLSMDKTFPDRRKMIVEGFSRVDAVISKYPTLVGEKQLCKFYLKDKTDKV